jgi:uncharacterized membrane protein
MSKNRMEAFSDGVIAILITIMVLELKAPHGAELPALRPLLPVFLSYVLSFVFLGIYWNNHHHLFQAVRHVRGPALWANLHLLFWLSLTPAVTAWSALARAIGDDLKGRISVAIYVVAIAVALAHPGLACALYVAVAIIWLVRTRGSRRRSPSPAGTGRTPNGKTRQDRPTVRKAYSNSFRSEFATSGLPLPLAGTAGHVPESAASTRC